MRPLFTPPPPRNNVDGKHRRTRIHAAIWAAFAVSAVPAVWVPQAGANIVVGAGYSSSIPDTQSHDYVVVEASYTGAASLTVESGGALTAQRLVISGGNGGNDGDGGAASLTVTDTLTAEHIAINRGQLIFGSTAGTGGAATLSVGTLDVTGQNTVLQLAGTAASDVTFTNVKLGDWTLEGRSVESGSQATIGTLTLTGAGLLADSGGALKIGKLAFDGGTLKDTNWDGLVGTGRTYTSTNDITLGTNGLIVDLASSKTLDRKLTGTGELTKTGTGTLTLTAPANSFFGVVYVDEGTLELADPGAAGTGDVNVANGATLRLSANGGTYTNSLFYGSGANSTLEVTNTGVLVQKITGFQNLNFILPAATAAGAAMLEVTGGLPTVFAQMTKIGVAIAGGGSTLKMGDTVTLLTNAHGLQNSGGTVLEQGTNYQQVNITGRQGISLDYGFALDNDANSIFAQVTAAPKPKPTPQPQPKPQPQPDPKPQPQPTPPQPQPQPQPDPQPQPGPQVNPQTKAIPEGRAAGMGMLNLGADQIVRMTGNLPNRTGGGAPNFGGSGSANGASAPSDTTAFARLSGYDQKIATGSHVNVNGASAIVGAAKVLPLAGGGTAAVGAFFEYGDGSFKTHNGFDTGDVNGKGNSDYYGAGVLARVNLAGSGSADGGGAPFVEGSVHAGRIHNNWHTDDLRDAATGQRAQYDIRTPYLGGHVGAGYRWQTGANTQVEVFGQYLYTHMDGKDTTVALDPYHFNAVKSSRTRIGAKADWKVNNTTSAYAGAAWEREFDGTARATAYSFDVPAPTMKGNSAVIDAGLSFQPKRNLTTNVGVTGYAGKRRGASANVEVQYLF